eukprot:3224074-Prymnesium_polylepis.1
MQGVTTPPADGPAARRTRDPGGRSRCPRPQEACTPRGTRRARRRAARSCRRCATAAPHPGCRACASGVRTRWARRRTNLLPVGA